MFLRGAFKKACCESSGLQGTPPQFPSAFSSRLPTYRPGPDSPCADKSMAAVKEAALLAASRMIRRSFPFMAARRSSSSASPFIMCRRRHGGHKLRYQIMKTERDGFKFQPPGFQLGHIKQIIDDCHQCFA